MKVRLDGKEAKADLRKLSAIAGYYLIRVTLCDGSKCVDINDENVKDHDIEVTDLTRKDIMALQHHGFVLKLVKK